MLRQFNTKIHEGLSSVEAQLRLEEFGLNSVTKKTKNSIIKLIISQFASLLVIILLVAALISFLVGHTIDALAILAITLINAVIGFVQEYKADNAVKALKKMLLPTCKVIRDGKPQVIESQFLVPGDIVVLDAGDKVPADIYLRETFSLYLDEAILTGESLPVNKNLQESTEKDLSIFKGTLVTQGRATGVVYATGYQTEFGKIVNMLSSTQEGVSPLTQELDKLGRNLVWLVLGLSGLISALFYVRGNDIIDIFMTVVSLGVSAIPEGLPIVITLTLALGVQALAAKKAIVRKLNSIETLGATTVICTDKTGTLTKNEMTVKKIFLDNQEFEIMGSGYETSPKINVNSPSLDLFLNIAYNCNHSQITNDGTFGDPTELALKVLGAKSDLVVSHEILNENVFTSERKCMSTLHDYKDSKFLFTKGACEVILSKCSHVQINGQQIEITPEIKKQIERQTHMYSASALRVLALAYKKQNSMDESNLIFVGLVAMIDPPRESVKKSIELVSKASIDVKIITGDNPITAQAIASEIGLKNINMLTGADIAEINDQQLLEALKNTSIFARTNPKDKYRIVKTLQESGEIVAVSGDGVNDAPALKQANVGVAMGIKGTEATKEVADIVLEDDNFSTIVNTIGEGRRIYANIVSFIKYMLGVNFCTIASVTVLTLMGRIMPILPLQVLFINVATDALPALALGQSKPSSNLMLNAPRNTNQSLLRQFGLFIIVAFIIQSLCNVLAFETAGLFFDGTIELSRTLLFTQIVLFELVFVFVCKGGDFRLKTMFNDFRINISVVISLLMLMFVLYLPFFNEVFQTVQLSLQHWLYLIPLSLPALIIPKIVNTIKKTSS